MKSRRFAGAPLVGLLLLIVGACTWSRARDATPHAEGDEVVPTDQVVTGDFMTGGRVVRILGEVQGDVAVAGSDVTISGPVNGYVLSAGRYVTLDGRIGNDLWAAGATVDVDGRIGNNVMAAGRTVHVHPGTVIGHDAHLAGNVVTAEGRIDRNLSIGASAAHIGADVGGNVDVRAGHVTVQPGTVIQGDLVVRAPQPPDVSPQARIDGATRFHRIDEDRGWAARPWLWIVCFSALCILGLAAIAFSPAWAGRVAGIMRIRPGASAIAGLLVCGLTPLVAGVLMVTVVGVPLALVLLALYLVVLLLSGVFVSYRTGSWMLDRMHRSEASHWMRLVLGALVVSVGMLLPVVGWVIALIVLIIGGGALVLERREFRRELSATG